MVLFVTKNGSSLHCGGEPYMHLYFLRLHFNMCNDFFMIFGENVLRIAFVIIQ